MTINQAPKRSYAASLELSPTPSLDDGTAGASLPPGGLGDPGENTGGTNVTGESPKKRWVRMASDLDPSLSRADASTDPTQFTTGPTSSQASNSRRAITAEPVSGATPVRVTPEDAMRALGFARRAYPADLPSPGSVILNLGQRLERALDGAGEPIDAVRQADIAGVLLAAEMYAGTLWQDGMKERLETASWTDADRLRTLAQHLTLLGSHLLFPSGEPGQAARTPSLPILLKSHYDGILGARTPSQLQRHCRALTCFLQSAAPGEHAPLNRACADYLAGTGALQGVIDALVDALKHSDSATLLLRPGAARQTLLGRADVRRDLQAANERQQQFDAGAQWVRQAGELEDWLRSMDRPESPLGPELQALANACAACRMSDGSAQTIDTMRDALQHCVDVTSAAALDVHVERCATTIKASRSRWALHYSMDRITDVVDHYLKHPVATTAQAVQALGFPYEAVDRLRTELRKYVASSVPDDKLANVMAAAVDGTCERDYARRISQLVQDRLINPQTWPLWNKMVEDYRKEFPQRPSGIFDMVKHRDPSLIHRIPDVRPVAGAMYTNLFRTDDDCCMPVDEAYDMFKDALATAREAGVVAQAAESPPLSSQPLAQSVQPKNQ